VFTCFGQKETVFSIRKVVSWINRDEKDFAGILKVEA